MVYAHVQEAGALPCRLRLPAHDMEPSKELLATLFRVESETDCCLRLPRNRNRTFAKRPTPPLNSTSDDRARDSGGPASSPSRKRTTKANTNGELARQHQHQRWNLACLSCTHVPHSDTDGAIAIDAQNAPNSSTSAMPTASAYNNLNQNNGHVRPGNQTTE